MYPLLQVIVLNGEGKALSVARGLVTAGELQQSLADAVASFQPQVAFICSHTESVISRNCTVLSLKAFARREAPYRLDSHTPGQPLSPLPVHLPMLLVSPSQ